MALELLCLSHATTAKISSVSLSPCGNYVVSIDDAKQLYVWKWAEHKLIFTATTEHGKYQDVCFLPDLDSLYFLTAISDGGVCLWNLDPRTPTCRMIQRFENKSGALVVSTSTCGRFIASGHHGHYVQIYQRVAAENKGDIKFELGVMLKHGDSARQLCFSNPSKVASADPNAAGEMLDVYYIACCSDKGQIKIWAMHQKTGELIQSVALLTHRAEALASVCFSADSKQLLYSVSGFVMVLDLCFVNKKPGILQMSGTRSVPLPILGNRKCSLVAVDEEMPLCVCANDHGLFIWDREHMQLLPVSQHLAWDLSINWPPSPLPSQDPRFLCALALASGEVRIWDLSGWEVPEGLDTNKRRRVPRSYETKEDQEKEYEDRRIRKMQADQAEALERLKKKEEEKVVRKTKRDKSVSKDEEEIKEKDNEEESSSSSSSSSDSDDDSSSSDSSSGASSSSSSSSSDNEGNEGDVQRPAKQQKSVPMVAQDKAGAPGEVKWSLYFDTVIAQGGMSAVEVPLLTSKGFSKTEVQEAIVF